MKYFVEYRDHKTDREKTKRFPTLKDRNEFIRKIQKSDSILLGFGQGDWSGEMNWGSVENAALINARVCAGTG